MLNSYKFSVKTFSLLFSCRVLLFELITRSLKTLQIGINLIILLQATLEHLSPGLQLPDIVALIGMMK